MSMLLDAVQRQRSSQANSDPALAVMLPQQPAQRSLPWPRLLPVALAILGAAAGAAIAYQSQPTNAPAAPLTVAASAGPITVAARVSLPLPVEINPVEIVVPTAPTPAPELTAPPVSMTATLAAAPEPMIEAVQLLPTEPVQAEIADPMLLAAFEQALLDVGGVEQPAAEPSLPVVIGEPEPEIAAVEAADVNQAEQPTAELTPALQQALEDALQQAGMAPLPEQPLTPVQIPKLGQLPWAFQKRLPDLEVTAHVYASQAEKRWLRANGRELQEGDEAAAGLTVKEILPNEIILEMDNQAFRIPALGSI
ncbi:general secretion pathway protein GspB [Ferrimonas senticii]|uniref:general secretion pathway protein GspB n=1 Tax=Ferrimonas senticii TaxID=394566 RepID=UPI0003FE4DFA|nr:general secretion pathway protein GspB [Ferrimonas senticii]